jgi:hypothetical protein
MRGTRIRLFGAPRAFRASRCVREPNARHVYSNANLLKDSHMIALQKEFSMNRQTFGSYPGDEIGTRQVRCWLEVGHARVAVQIPAELLHLQRATGGAPLMLRVPSQQSIPVESQPLLTESQQKRARAWSSEMEGLDRF